MIEESKHYALAIVCGAKRGPKDSDLTFSPASLRDFLKALGQPEQEPVVKWDASAPLVVTPHPAFQATPQRREWVGLTKEEVNACDPQEECCNLLEVARAIEAKLKEKNNV